LSTSCFLFGSLFFTVISLQNAGYPRSWGQGFQAIAHVAADLVALPSADRLPLLMTEFAATRPVIEKVFSTLTHVWEIFSFVYLGIFLCCSF
jgi:hypothetical protein